MMMRTIFLRTLHDKRWFIAGWSLALSLMAILMVAMFPSLRDSMGQIAATMPEQIRGLVGDVASFSKLDSYLSSQLYDIRIPLFLMIMATILALGLGPANEEKGVVRTLLSTRTSRTSLYAQTWLSASLIFIIVIAATALTTVVAVWSIGETLAVGLVAKLALLSLLLAMTMFTIVYGLGMAFGSRMVALSVGVGVTISSIILEAGRAVDWLDTAQKASLLHYYDAGKILTTGIDNIHTLVQIILLIVFLLLGWLLFRRRDVG